MSEQPQLSVTVPAAQFGCAVRAWREANGVTQIELAERCGLKQPMISNIENTTRNRRVSEVAALSEATGIHLAFPKSDYVPLTLVFRSGEPATVDGSHCVDGHVAEAIADYMRALGRGDQDGAFHAARELREIAECL